MLADSFQFREVLANIVSQDFKVKYKRTSLGYLWSLMNPLLQLLVMTAVFSRFVGRGMKDYSLYLFSGMIAFNFFQNSMINAATVFIEYESFIKKVYLPKLIFPVSRLGIRSIDFLLSLVALALIGLVSRFPFHSTILALPAAIFLLFLMTLGSALLVSVMTVYFRDVQYLMTVAMQLLYFVTPILYPEEGWPPNLVTLFKMNPMYWQVNLFHQLIYFGRMPSGLEWGIASLLSVTFFCGGLLVLQKYEQDLIFKL